MGKSFSKHSSSTFSPSKFIPSNETQIIGAQVCHDICRELWGQNFIAPIHNELKNDDFKVLDVGCGPGSWVCELANDFRASCYGVDIQPTFPTQKPRNAQFHIANILNGLPFDDNFFDYIHVRFMIMFFTQEEWETKVIVELFRVLKPNGYLEFVEGDAMLNMPTSLKPLSKSGYPLLSQNSLPCLIRFECFLQETNKLENICHERKQLILGDWSNNPLQNKLGTLLLGLIRQSFKNHQDIFYSYISKKDFDKLLEQLPMDCNWSKAYIMFHRFVGKKKLAEN
ncbi:S-adenosyl-L-methionine-dependent methyltransferase [Gigaspora rosea]|uniref:S-adenosyl-L-methionine-dependent methyltransferase n=1 Tax=Gigaspora rosea TaxID=44941 RepID=A0A397UDV2_9GLOM|nr:S-adenosyl-L-methionine-dependent methyltransferase [Gigaspora rosea]